MWVRAISSFWKQISSSNTSKLEVEPGFSNFKLILSELAKLRTKLAELKAPMRWMELAISAKRSYEI